MLSLLTDYIPLLQNRKHALAIYLYYSAIKDERGRVKPSYKALNEHLGLAHTTICKANEALCELGLLKPQTFSEDEPTRNITYYEVLDPAPFSSAERKKNFEKGNLAINTSIRTKLLSIDNLPLEYQQLLSLKDLRRALKKLGKDNFNLRELVKFFNLDNEVVRLWGSNPIFVKKFTECKKAILNGKSIESTEKQKARKKTKAKKAPDEIYKSLMRAHIDKKTGKEKPTHEWQPVQLLRYFCRLYEKKNGCKYVLLTINSKELKDMKSLLDAFKGDAEKAVRYLDWVFAYKDDTLSEGVLATGICVHSRMLNEFEKTSSTKRETKFRHTDPIDSEFVNWIKTNVPEYSEVANMRDLYWLKDEYDNEEESIPIKSIVEEGIKRGIIPSKGNIVFK